MTTPPVFLEFAGLAVTDADKREVGGLALPYAEDLERLDWATGATRQRFELGSAVVRDNATLFYGHDHLQAGLPIGRITAHEHTPEGLRITARISTTSKGDEVYTLLRDGVLDRFSVGFYPVANVLGDVDTPTPVLTHTEIDVFEVSVVPDPAYQSAVVDSILSRTPGTPATATPPKESAMPCVTCSSVHPAGVTACPVTFATAAEVTTLAGSIDTLERRLATLGDTGPATVGPTAPGASYGEFLQLLSAGDPGAGQFLAYVGSTTDDLGAVLKDSWVGDTFRQIQESRTVLNLFASSPLPATGMGVEYGKIGADTTQVAPQIAEGDTLAYGKLTFTTARAALETFGGWGEMSRQLVDRSPVNVVERFFSALVTRYAQATEARVAAALKLEANATELGGTVLDLATSDGWIKFVIRAARALKAQGLPLEFVTVGFDVFEDLALLRDGAAVDAPRLLDRASGSINVPGLSGELFSLPVVPVETGATVGFVRAGHSSAIRTYEAGGAPFRLQDDDVTNLSKAFSLYGYMATAVEDTAALIRPADGI